MKRVFLGLIVLVMGFPQLFVSSKTNDYYKYWDKPIRSNGYILYSLYHTSEGVCPKDIIVVIYIKLEKNGFFIDKYYSNGKLITDVPLYWPGNTDVSSIKLFNRKLYFIDEYSDYKVLICLNIELKEIWRKRLSARKDEKIEIDINNDYVVLSVSDQIYVLDEADGTLLVQYKGTQIDHSYYCGYLLKMTNVLELFNPKSNSSLWESDLPVKKIKCFGVWDDIVLIAMEGAIKDKKTKVFSLDASNGKTLWSLETGQEIINIHVSDFGLIYETKYSETEKSFNTFTVNGGFCWWGKTSLACQSSYTECNAYSIEDNQDGFVQLRGINTDNGKFDSWRVSFRKTPDYLKKVLFFDFFVVYFDFTGNRISCFLN